MADTSVVDLDADFVLSGRCDFDIFNGEVFAGFPRNGGLTAPSVRSQSSRARSTNLAGDGLEVFNQLMLNMVWYKTGSPFLLYLRT
jgi:hypothetical protein